MTKKDEAKEDDELYPKAGAVVLEMENLFLVSRIFGLYPFTYPVKRPCCSICRCCPRINSCSLLWSLTILTFQVFYGLGLLYFLSFDLFSTLGAMNIINTLMLLHTVFNNAFFINKARAFRKLLLDFNKLSVEFQLRCGTKLMLLITFAIVLLIGLSFAERFYVVLFVGKENEARISDLKGDMKIMLEYVFTFVKIILVIDGFKILIVFLPIAIFGLIAILLRRGFSKNHKFMMESIESGNWKEFKKRKLMFYKLCDFTESFSRMWGNFIFFHVFISSAALGFIAYYHIQILHEFGVGFFREFGGRALWFEALLDLFTELLSLSLLLYFGMILNETPRGTIKMDLLYLQEYGLEDRVLFEVERIVDKLDDWDWAMSAAGYFPLDRNSILSIVSIVFTLLIIWIQFQQGDAPPTCQCAYGTDSNGTWLYRANSFSATD